MQCHVPCTDTRSGNLLANFSYFGIPSLAVSGLLLIIPYTAPIFLNHYRKYLLAKIWIKVVLDLATFIFAVICRPESHIYNGFFLSFVLPFLMLRSLRAICLTASLSPILYLIYKIWQPPAIYDIGDAVSILGSIVSVTIFLLSGAIPIWSLQKHSRVSRKT